MRHEDILVTAARHALLPGKTGRHFVARRAGRGGHAEMSRTTIEEPSERDLREVIHRAGSPA